MQVCSRRSPVHGGRPSAFLTERLDSPCGHAHHDGRIQGVPRVSRCGNARVCQWPLWVLPRRTALTHSLVALLPRAHELMPCGGSPRSLTTRTPSSIALDVVASPLRALPCLETPSSHTRLSHVVHSGVSQAPPHQVPHLLRACRGGLYHRLRVRGASAAPRRYPGQSLGEKMPAVGAGTGVDACCRPCRVGAWLRRDKTRSWP